MQAAARKNAPRQTAETANIAMRTHTKFDEDGNIITEIEEPAMPIVPPPALATAEEKTAADEDSIDLGDMIEQIPFVGADETVRKDIRTRKTTHAPSLRFYFSSGMRVGIRGG